LSGLGRKLAGTGNPHGGRKSASPGASPIPDSVASDPPTAARKRRERRARALARKKEAHPKAAEGRAAAAKQGPTEDAAHQPSTHASRDPRGVAARQNRSGGSGGSSGGSSGGATAAEKSAEGKAAAATPGPTGEAAHHPSTHARRDPPGQTGGVAARQQRSGGAAAAAEAAGDARSTAACQGEVVRGSAAPPLEPGGESSMYESPPPSSKTGPGALTAGASSFVPPAVRSFDGSGAFALASVKAKRALDLSPLKPGEPLPYGGAKHAAKRPAGPVPPTGAGGKPEVERMPTAAAAAVRGSGVPHVVARGGGGPPAGPAGLRDLARPHLHAREVKDVV